MWQEHNTWARYLKNIVAADAQSAVLLASYVRRMNFDRRYAAVLEVIDLNKYKVIRSTAKVKQLLNERSLPPFVFVINRN